MTDRRGPVRILRAMVGNETVRIPFARVDLDDDVIKVVSEVLTSGWLTTGPRVLAFERELAAYLGVENAVAVSSCTAALEISLRCLGLPRGSKVLTSTMTFCGAVHAIVHAGLEPVLVDVDPVTLMPDAEAVAAARQRAGAVSGMVVTDHAGYPADVAELADAAGLPLGRVVADAAHSLGGRIRGRLVGTLAGATCFSFYATKNLAIGEGGMITTADGELASRARSLRLHGMSQDAWRRYLPGASWRYAVADDGLKANMTDLQAAIGQTQLRRFDETQRQRRDLALAYDGQLAGIPGVELPARPADGGHAWHLYVIRVGAESAVPRDDLITGLAERGIGCSVHFIPIHHHPYFQRLLGGGGELRFPGADRAFEQIVSLPLYPGLGHDGVTQVSEAVADLAGGGV